MRDGDQKPRQRVEGLKQIARFCGWDSTTTVKKYYAESGLPLHTVGSLKKPRYFAWADELNAWIAERDQGRKGLQHQTGLPVEASELEAVRHLPGAAQRASSSREGPSMARVVGSAGGAKRTRGPSPRFWSLSAVAALALVAATVLAIAWDRPKDQSLPLPEPVGFNPRIDLELKGSDFGGLAAHYRGTVLWENEALSRYRAVVAVLGRNQRPQIVGLRVSSWTGPGFGSDPTLIFLDPWTGEETAAARPLQRGGTLFPNYSESYGGSLQAVDLNHDEVDELLAIFEHSPNWPGYSVLYVPKFDRVATIYASTGHHRFKGQADLNGDGWDDLLFEGPNNLMGWRSSLAAVQVIPNVETDTKSSFIALSPNHDFLQPPTDALLWFAVNKAPNCAPVGCIKIDESNQTIRYEHGPNAGMVLDFRGFDTSLSSALTPERRSAIREEAYQLVRAALRAVDRNELDGLVAPVSEAIRLVEPAGLPHFFDYLRHLEVRMLALSGQLDTARERALSLQNSPPGEHVHVFDIATSFHLAGDPFEAEKWYRRGLRGNVSVPGQTRPSWELVRGLVLVLVDQGKFAQASETIAHYDTEVGLHGMGSQFNTYVRWRAGILSPDDLPTGCSGSPSDYYRYWCLAIARDLRATPLDDLLQQVRGELLVNSEASSMLMMLEADLLDELGNAAVARSMRIEALTRVRNVSRSNPVIRSHLLDLETRGLADLGALGTATSKVSLH